MHQDSDQSPARLLGAYYAATALFLVLDYAGGVNLRVAGLDGHPVWRAAYYLFCFACLAGILWRPAWSAAIGLGESVIAMGMLIISIGGRVMVVSDAVIEGRADVVSMRDIASFVIYFLVAYFSFNRQLAALSGR